MNGERPAADTAGLPRGNERGAVAVALLLLFVLGAGVASSARAVAAARGAAPVGVAIDAGARAERVARHERRRGEAASPAVVPPLPVTAPRFSSLAGHAWPPPRAPGSRDR